MKHRHRHRHEIIAECKLVLEGVSVSHVICMGKTSNSRYNRYKYSGLFLSPKILLCAKIPNGFKIFPNRNHVFPHSLLNS